jgi:nucleotide-binding universal stress UspA family protein
LKESQQSLNADALVDHARVLWRNASIGANRGRVELYTKASLRLKATRSVDAKSVTVDRALESGVAVRTSITGQPASGFAASSGLSEDVVRWAVAVAGRNRAMATVAAPEPSDAIAEERRDLDPDESLPTTGELIDRLQYQHEAEWVEAGTTVEVLVGASGWVAARRRHRVWALTWAPSRQLLAQRGISGWDRLLGGSVSEAIPHHPNTRSDSGDIVLLPSAAAVVVSALVETFHGGDSEWVEPGTAWDVIDVPVRSNGLVGGSFDDAGFPTAARVLAKNGVWVGGIRGPGTFRRVSFREPPRETASNLVMGGSPVNQIRGLIALRCHILRLSSDEWILELDLADASRKWVRSHPKALLAACRERMGGAIVTANGPIVPAMRFEGLVGIR